MTAAALPSIGSAESASQGDIRGFDWGTSIQAVKAQERATLVFVSDDVLKYDTELVGRRMELLYIFADKRLESVSYHYEPYHECGGQFAEQSVRVSCELRAVLSAFKEVMVLLSEKYGLPQRGDPNQHCFDDEATMGQAILQDSLLSPMCHWASGRSEIVLSAHRAVQSPSQVYYPLASLLVSFDGNAASPRDFDPEREKKNL